MKHVVPDYKADAHHIEAHAVSDGDITTARGEASREFAYEILKALGVYDEEALAEFAEFWSCRLGAPASQGMQPTSLGVTRVCRGRRVA